MARVNAASAGDINVHRAFAVDMNYRVKREGPEASGAVRRLYLVQVVRLMSNWLNMKSSIRPTRLPETPAPAVTFHP